MSSRRAARGLFAVSLVAGIVSASAAFAVDNPLDVVPEDAVAVVRFKKPKTTIDNAIKMAAALDREKSLKLRQLSNGLGAKIHNPQGTSVDAKYDWFVIYIAPPAGNQASAQPGVAGAPGATPSYTASSSSFFAGAAIVYAMPAVKVDQMETAVKQSLPGAKTVKHENWLLYSDSDAAIQHIQSCKSGRVKPIRDAIDPQSKGVMDAADLSMYFNVRSLTRGRYKLELEAARLELEEALKNPAGLAPASVQGVDLKPLYEGYSQILQAGWQALNDCESVTLGATVKSAKGVDMEVYARVETGSPTSDAFKSTSTSPMHLLEKLPPGHLFYSASHGNFEMLTKWSMTMARTFTQDEQARKTLDEAIAEYSQIEFGTTATAFDIGDTKNGVFRTISVSEMKPADKVKSVTRKTVGALSKISLGQLNQTTELKEDAETIADQKVDLLEIKSNAGADASGFQAELMKSINGEDGSTKRIVYLPDLVVQTEGGGVEAMEAALASLGVGKKPASTDPAAAKNPLVLSVRSQLAPSANFVMLVDVGGAVAEGVKSFLGQLGGLLNLSAEQAKKLSVKRSYLGLSAGVEPSGARVKVHVPLAQIQSLAKMGDLLAPFLPFLTPGGATPGGAGAPTY